MSLRLIFSFLLLSLCACKKNNSTTVKQDTEQIRKEKREQRKRDSLLKAVKIPKGGNNLRTDLDQIKTLTQEELKPFLKEYGINNPETLVKITTKFGDIKVRLFTDTPLHRANFIRLVKLGYFDSSFFHRVAQDFVVQGGNSDLQETHKLRAKIGNYLIPNEINKKYTHKRGAFSAAKYSEQNVSKASSPFEFFIVQSQRGAHHLDKDHTVFGEVLEGMQVVDKIAAVAVDQSEWPIKNIFIKAAVIR